MTPLELTADREGERLDAFLARSVPDLTRSAAQRLLEQGAVTLQGRPAKKNERTRPGDRLTVCLPEPQPCCTTVAAPSPGSTGSFAPASSTASTGTPPA